MNWLKDFFFCNTWREFFAMAVLVRALIGIHLCSGRCWCLCLCCSDSLLHGVANIYFKENQMTNETNEYTEAYAAALGVATDSKITHDTLVAFRTEINFLRREMEGLRVTVAELTTIALGDDKFDKWFDDKVR
jgi:hypothetical protein